LFRGPGLAAFLAGALEETRFPAVERVRAAEEFFELAAASGSLKKHDDRTIQRTALSIGATSLCHTARASAADRAGVRIVSRTIGGI
jgi:hypothetical protein